MELLKLIHTDIEYERLSKEIFQLIEQFDLHELTQISLTSIAGENNWINSVGKRHLLKYPERYFNKINQYLEGTYVSECIRRYPDFYRWRLMKINSRSTYTVHCDGADSSRNLRLHIPVITNPEAYLVFFNHCPGNGAVVSTKFEHLAVGNSYEVDTTSWHTAFNFGSEPRYHIVGVRYESINNGSH